MSTTATYDRKQSEDTTTKQEKKGARSDSLDERSTADFDRWRSWFSLAHFSFFIFYREGDPNYSDDVCADDMISKILPRQKLWALFIIQKISHVFLVRMSLKDFSSLYVLAVTRWTQTRRCSSAVVWADDAHDSYHRDVECFKVVPLLYFTISVFVPVGWSVQHCRFSCGAVKLGCWQSVSPYDFERATVEWRADTFQLS